MNLYGFTLPFYLLALLLALVSQRSEACGDEYQESERIEISAPAI